MEVDASSAAAHDAPPAFLRPDVPRLQNTEYILPCCFGTVAYWLGKKADEYHSHRWTVYFRGHDGEDVTHAVKRVVFALHPSFKEAVRVLEHPPFEVTETGWGEFEIGITVHWKDDVRVVCVLFHAHTRSKQPHA